MIKHIFVAVLVAASATAYPMQSLAAGQDWYPKASDLCAEYVTKTLKSKEQGARLVTPTKDPAIAKYVSDFNAHYSNVSKKGGEALLDLFIYCLSHGATKLGDVTAKAVIADTDATLSESPASAPSPSTPEQRALADQWTLWLKQSLEFCGTNERCKEVANRSFVNNVRCTQGDRVACDAHARDVEDWNAEYRATQAAGQTTLLCKMVLYTGEAGGDMNYVVDFDKKTVNGHPATITDNVIQFDVSQPSATIILNRLSGGVTWFSSDRDVLARGECVKATQRQF